MTSETEKLNTLMHPIMDLIFEHQRNNELTEVETFNDTMIVLAKIQVFWMRVMHSQEQVSHAAMQQFFSEMLKEIEWNDPK